MSLCPPSTAPTHLQALPPLLLATPPHRKVQDEAGTSSAPHPKQGLGALCTLTL